MFTKNSCVMSMLAVVAAVSLDTVVMAQQAQTLNRTTVLHDHRKKPSEANVHDHRTQTPSRPNLNIHDHRGEQPSGSTTPGGTRVPPPRAQPPRRSGPYVPTLPGSPGAMSFAEASQLFSRHKQMRLTPRDLVGRDEPEFVSPPPDSESLLNAYYVTGTTNRKLLGVERFPSGGFNSKWNAAYLLSWNPREPAAFSFHRKSSAMIPIRYGEPLAIQIEWWTTKVHAPQKQRSYLVNSKIHGQTIHHSKEKSFEWALIGGTPGRQIKAGDVVVLYNLKRQQPLIYFRGQPADVGWPDKTDIKDGYQQVAKMRAAAKVLLMPGVVVGK